MARDDKSKYTQMQEPQANHNEASYSKKGAGKGDSRAWGTVNQVAGGGNKPTSPADAKKRTTKTNQDKTRSRPK